MTPEDAYRALWREVLTVMPKLPQLQAFLPPLPKDPLFNGATPSAAAPGLDFEACLPITIPDFRPLIETLIKVKQSLEWRQSYTEDDGVDAAFLHGYGHISLTGPDAPFQADDHRLFLIHFGPRSFYPEHQHLPAEVYGCVAGQAEFSAEGRADILAGPGDCVHHVSDQIHATRMMAQPYVALIGWRAEDLTVAPKIVANS